MPERRPFTITKLERDQDGGFWRARVTQDGATISVDRRYGSWQADLGDDGRRELRRDVAAELAAKVYPIERAERAAREAERKAAIG